MGRQNRLRRAIAASLAKARQAKTERETRDHEVDATDLIMDRVRSKAPERLVALPIREHPSLAIWRETARRQQEAVVPRLQGNVVRDQPAEPDAFVELLVGDEALKRAANLVGFGGIRTRLNLLKTAMKWFGIGAFAGDVLDPTERLGEVNVNLELGGREAVEPLAPIDGAINASMTGTVDVIPFLQETQVGVYLGREMLGVIGVGCFRGLIDGMNMVTRSKLRAVIVRGA